MVSKQERPSVVVAIDGESKCGKTTLVSLVAAETPLSDNKVQPGFSSVTAISAGNLYRAATLYKMQLTEQGHAKERFGPRDSEPLRELLATPGILDRLQQDPAIGKQVSTVANMLGVQAVCETVLCETITSAYRKGGGNNLVVIDGRNPVGCMQRHGLVGNGEGEIPASTILPAYMDTPADVAAMRMGGDFSDNLAIVTNRRLADATRPELPATKPPVLIDNVKAWARQFDEMGQSTTQIATPLHIYNGQEVSLEDLQRLSSTIVQIALTVTAR